MKWQEREKRRELARTRLFVKLLTTYGYGCLAAGTSFALLEGVFAIERLNVPLFMAGLAIHALAIYVTPEGDEDADQS